MKNRRVYLITNKSQAAKDVKKWFKRPGLKDSVQLVNSPKLAEFFIVSGGDGTLLHAIDILWKHNKPFFGIHRGTSGFLLNEIKNEKELVDVLDNFKKCKAVKLRMLKGDFWSVEEKRPKTFYAFNDFYIKSGKGNQRITGTVRGVKNFSKHFFDGDGIIISTPQGSTAYNYSAGGSIIPLGVKKLAVKSICARASLNAVVSEQKIVGQIERGLALAYSDHRKISNRVKKFEITPDAGEVALLFKPHYNFERERRRT